MKSPRDMRIVQIDVTNACFHHCSNCTRFCGHHKKPFFMSFETFKKAVDSLDGYVGAIGIMGGEPTLHPEFPRMAKYLASRRPPKKDNKLIYPQTNFMDAIHDLEFEYAFPHPCSYGGRRHTVNGPGLFSAIGEGYKKYYEVIQDTIQYQAVNDHSRPMYHQPALITRKELGIPDDEWKKLRDACWVQNLWSATITPKGAFFCEIAGSLDMLFDGPGGWKIEPGWWQRGPQDFGDQLHWCEMCGLACHTFTRNANEEVDDVSPHLYERLKEMGSPKVQSGKISIVKIEDGKIAEESKASIREFSDSIHYVDSYNDRFDEKKTNLTQKKIIGVYVCQTLDEIETSLQNNSYIKTVYLLAPGELHARISSELVKDIEITFLDANERTLGYALYRALSAADYNTYALVLSRGIRLSASLEEGLGRMVLNPGTFIYTDKVSNVPAYFETDSTDAEAALLNGTASSVVSSGWDKVLRVKSLQELRGLWNPDKVIAFAPDMERRSPTSTVVQGQRYVVYGAGNECERELKRLKDAGACVVALLDTNEKKWGKEVQGMVVQKPEYLKEHAGTFDGVLITTGMRYREIKPIVLSYGIPEERIVLPL